MGRPEDEAQAPTLIQTAPERASHSRAPELTPGTVVGRYLLERRLGAGAMGVVWSAQDPQLDRKIAIKLLHPSLARTPDASARLLREARAMAKLSHRSVVTVHDAGEVDGQLFLAMELVQGTTLGAMLRARNAEAILDWPRWLGLMLEAGRGLAAAHHGGVLHRDFKPDNVLVDESGRVCVGDFGLASLGEEAFAEMTSRWDADAPLDLTTTGALLGTPAYMSPQQLRGEPIDARADQFNFCVACHEALYGVRPFAVPQQGLDAIPALAAAIELGALPEPPAGSTVPADVRAVIKRGLAADPAARWPDMETLVTALERAGSLDRRRPASVLRDLPPARGGTRWIVGAAVLAVALGIAAFAIGRRGSSPTTAPPMAAPSPVTARRLFAMSMRAGMALSIDAKRLALSSDRLEVRSLVDAQMWTSLLAAGEVITHIEFDGPDLLFGTRSQQDLRRWHYASDGSITLEVADLQGGEWVGRTRFGDLVYLSSKHRLLVLDHGHLHSAWTIDDDLGGESVSPDGNRVAYIDTERFAGKVIVRDLATGVAVRSESLISPTAVTWLDDATLAFATGTLVQPRISRVTVGPTFGTPVEIYGVDAGWFGQIVGRGDRLVVSELHPSPRSRLVKRDQPSSPAHDFDHASVALGWTDAGEILTWSLSTQRVERRGETSIELTKVVLDGEPANATTAGDTLIAALRRPAGREAIAVSLASGQVLWRHGDGQTLAVRCAGDHHAPCFAIRTGGQDRVFTLDPATGELGTTPIYAGKLDDIAVSEDGARLLVTENGAVREIDAQGATVAIYETSLTVVRSLAYERGGVLVAGTLIRNDYQAGEIRDGKYHLLTQADDDILSLVRASPDGAQVAVLSRTFASELWQLTLR